MTRFTPRPQQMVETEVLGGRRPAGPRDTYEARAPRAESDEARASQGSGPPDDLRDMSRGPAPITCVW